MVDVFIFSLFSFLYCTLCGVSFRNLATFPVAWLISQEFVAFFSPFYPGYLRPAMVADRRIPIVSTSFTCPENFILILILHPEVRLPSNVPVTDHIATISSNPVVAAAVWPPSAPFCLFWKLYRRVTCYRNIFIVSQRISAMITPYYAKQKMPSLYLEAGKSRRVIPSPRHVLVITAVYASQAFILFRYSLR